MVKRAIVLAALALVACKQRGTITLEVTGAGSCSMGSADDKVSVYFVKGASCGSMCGTLCGTGNCVDSCKNCTASDLATGLPLDPSPGPDTYAVQIDEVGSGSRYIARGCAGSVEIDADGTASRAVAIDLSCCAP
jgi:hypothetical protein